MLQLLHTKTLNSRHTNEVHVFQALISWFTYMRLQDIVWKISARTLAKLLALINLGKEKKKTKPKTGGKKHYFFAN